MHEFFDILKVEEEIIGGWGNIPRLCPLDLILKVGWR
jgi:hypothetical protein